MLHVYHGQISPEGMVTTCTSTSAPRTGAATAVTQMIDPAPGPAVTDVTDACGSPVTSSTGVTSDYVSATPMATLPPSPDVGDGSSSLPTLHEPEEEESSADGWHLFGGVDRA